MKHDHRWLKSALTTSEDVKVVMPWTRGAKTRPAAFKAAPAPMPTKIRTAIAAR